MTTVFNHRESCPVCDSQSSGTLVDIPYTNAKLKSFLDSFYQGRVDNDLLSGGHYRIEQCSDCDFIYQSEVLNDEGMMALYSEWIDATRSLQKKQSAKFKLFKQYYGQIETLSRMIKKPPHQVHVLEYGMGWGYWSRMAKACGYQVQGYELSEERIEHARSIGVEVIDKLPPANSSYDFIYSNQVFEHLVEPLETLRELQSRLKPDGYIYLRVPDAAGLDKTIKRSGWQSDMDVIHPLEHINGFTRGTLLLLAERAGLHLVQPPPRVSMNSLWGSIKREWNDRFVTTHVYLKPRQT